MSNRRIDPVITYLKNHRVKHLGQMQDFLSIPSISALSEHHQDIRKAAGWLKDRLQQAGFLDARVDETKGNPVVRAETAMVPGQTTVLVYGHYDVQPVDPLSSWHHPPFQPTVENDILYARGASDDKGQVFMQLIAAEAWQKAGNLPVNLKFLFEGEEEIGSVHLQEYISEHQSDLAADLAVISDTPMYADEYPAISYGLRGLLAVEIQVDGPYQDLHSGVYGGAVQNPAHALALLIASLHDDKGRVSVPGFYDQVEALSERERQAYRALPFDEERYREELRVPSLFGEEGYSVWERLWARPTLEVNGMWSGFTGEGQKTIIPSSAHAKISCRLVPHQDPLKVYQAVEAHLRAQVPPGVSLEIHYLDGAPASLTPLDHPAIKAAEDAILAVYEKKAAYIRMGGSIPVVGDFFDILHVPTVLLGFALPNENFHAPNEHFHLKNFYRGAETLATFWERLGRDHGRI